MLKRPTLTGKAATLTLGAALLLPALLLADSERDTFNGLWVFQPGEPIHLQEVQENFEVVGDHVAIYEDAIHVDPATGQVTVQKADTEDGVPTFSVEGPSTFNQNVKVRISGSTDANSAQIYAEDSAAKLSLGAGGEPGDLVITPDGKVGIGTTQPEVSLDVAGTVRSRNLDVEYGTGERDGLNLRGYSQDFPFTSRIWFRGSDLGEEYKDSYLYWREDHIRFRSTQEGATAVLDIDMASERVGINQIDPQYPLDVNGTVRATLFDESSDIRLKKEIAPLIDPIAGVECLRGVTYRLRDPDADQAIQLGLIAQEVERCYPEVVHTDSQGMKSVSYARLIAPLIEATKAQQDRIGALEERDRQRVEHLRALEARLSALEAAAP